MKAYRSLQNQETNKLANIKEFDYRYDLRRCSILDERLHFSRMKRHDVLLLRKQQSRRLCVCSCVPVGQAGILRYFLDSRFRGNDTPQPASFCSGAVFSSGGRGEILHSAKCYDERRGDVFPSPWRERVGGGGIIRGHSRLLFCPLTRPGRRPGRPLPRGARRFAFFG